MSHNSSILIFGDGACSGNPGPGGWGTIVYLPEGKIFELGGHNPQTTNNVMEMIAIREGLKKAKGRTEKIKVLSDSVYVLKGITEWIHSWKRKGWKTFEGKDVANVQEWIELEAVVRGFKSGQIEWGYVPGHKGVAGNERVDEIAVAFSQNSWPSLYAGDVSGYRWSIFDIPSDTSIPEMNFNKGEKKQPYSYLSYVNGVLEKHATWAECEARVKGRAGAKFKKAMSENEEQEILKSWGLK